MNLAELHRRQQESVGRAAAAASPEAQSSHRRLATGYGDRIKNFDEQMEERSTLRHSSVVSASASADAVDADLMSEQGI
jgi:DNA-binding transcriptional regulator LsrR (DeoR family)